MPGKALTLSELAAVFDRASAGMSGGAPEPLMKVLAVTVSADAKTNFDRGVGPDDTPWAPLAFPRASGGSRPLRDKGLLMASMIGGANHVERLSPGMLIVGTNRIGAKLMQDGGTIPPTKGKALAIPLTREAARADGPLSFPRALFMIWRKGATSGILAEANQKGRGKKKFTEIIAQFALVSKVTVTARPFLGAGQRLIVKVNRVIRGWFADQFQKGG